MIHRIYSNLDSFKELVFQPGLNVLLADKSPGATDRQTRNGAGKTSLIEIVHFLFGSQVDKDSIFKNDDLVKNTFGMEVDLQKERLKIERCGQRPSEIRLIGDLINWPTPLPVHDLFGERIISNTSWKIALRVLMFGLKNTDNDEVEGKYEPSFRSLFAYFVRRQMSGGFISAIKHSTQQQIWDQQVAISYLLGLDWQIPQKWEQIRQKERTLKELRKAAKEGTLGTIIGSTADLRTELTISEGKALRLKENISSFRILSEYHDLEVEASEIARQLGKLADENTLDRELRNELQKSIEGETPPADLELSELYREVGIVLPEIVTKRFEDVRSFHESIIQNRKLYLLNEIQAAAQRINEREISKGKLGIRYSEIMRLLKSHGALDQYTELQSELGRIETQTELLRQRFESAKQLESRKTELEIERNRLLLLLQQDYQEQKESLQRAILVFQEISNSLYEQAGSLKIQESSNGPVFEVKIQGSKSKGISNMQMFCFDMMLMQLCVERGIGPGFLIHDSHLFDGVDERQVRQALLVGARLAERFNFQYIVTMNSDVIPRGESTEFNIDNYVLPLRLTDKTENGGLFGLRF